MDGFEFQALLWLLSVNQFKFTHQEIAEVIMLREALLTASYEDRAKRSFVNNALFPRRIAFSVGTVDLARKMLLRITEMRPDRFGLAALRTRQWIWIKRAVVTLSLMFLASNTLGVPELTMTLFVLGSLSLVPSIMLFRATGLVKRLLHQEKT